MFLAGAVGIDLNLTQEVTDSNSFTTYPERHSKQTFTGEQWKLRNVLAFIRLIVV